MQHSFTAWITLRKHQDMRITTDAAKALQKLPPGQACGGVAPIQDRQGGPVHASTSWMPSRHSVVVQVVHCDNALRPKGTSSTSAVNPQVNAHENITVVQHAVLTL